MKVFIPMILRKQLLKKAKRNNWYVSRQKGTNHRNWEGDLCLFIQIRKKCKKNFLTKDISVNLRFDRGQQ